MTLLWMDGFDHYGVDANLLLGCYAQEGGTLTTSGPRTGSHCYNISSQNGFIRKVLPAAKTTVGLAIGYYTPALPLALGRQSPMIFSDGANARHITILVTPTGQIEAVRGTPGSGPQIGISALPAVVAGTWHHIEAKVLFSNTVGTVEVRVDGVTVLNLTGQDTVNTGDATCAQISIGHESAGATHSYLVDDLFIWDALGSHNNDFIGDRRVLTLYPNADTAETDWVRNTGSTDCSAIDETTQDGDTTYIEAAAATDISDFGLDNLPAEVVAVSGVMTLPMLKKTDAGPCNVRSSMVSGASIANGSDRPVTTTYTYWPDIFETDPATGAPWTPGAVNSAQARLERTI